MHILESTEVSKILLDPKTRKISKHPEIYEQLLILKVGEALLLKKGEWKSPTPPYHLISFHQKGRRFAGLSFSCRKTAEGGWLIIRVK